MFAPAVGHRHQTAAVPAAVEWRVHVDLVGEGFAPRALTAGAVAQRIAALNHESLHDAVERHAVVVAMLGEQPEVLDGSWRVGREELDRDRRLVRVECSACLPPELLAPGGTLGLTSGELQPISASSREHDRIW